MSHKTSGEKFEILVAENRFVTDVQLAIERAMDEIGATQADLARKLDVSEARVSQLLSDTGKNLQVRTIARISHALCLHPTLRLVDKEAYAESRKIQKRTGRGGPFRDWIKSLEDCPTASWNLACNDDQEHMGLEAA
jgi:transcriptional regulator with XRE-family HTH domain